MSGSRLGIQETAAYLRTLDDVLLLTHVRPDGDTIGSAAALCQALRDMGKTAYLLYNPEITDTYAPYAAPYWAPEGFTPAHIVSADIAALNLLPDNAAVYAPRIELAIDLRYTPEPQFIMDDSIAHGAHILDLLNHVKPANPANADIVLPEDQE